MRKLPVFFLIDVSESMVGEPIKNVNKGLNQIISQLKNNPIALETVFISIIIFAGKPQLISPLSDLISYCPPDLPIGGGTSLGAGMMFLMDEIDYKVQKTTIKTKGDWKPLVFLFTDGVPTDNVKPAIDRWKNNYINKANLIAISFGNTADLTILKQFTENVLVFSNTDSETYKKFFEWISSSIEAKSMNVMDDNNNFFQLDEIKDNFLVKADLFSYKDDDRHAILLSRCHKTKRPYLMKFSNISSGMYSFEGSYTISEKYFSLTEKHENQTININQLVGGVNCPECGNQNVASCACGKLSCLDQKTQSITCPWCEQSIQIEISSDFNISRVQG